MAELPINLIVIIAIAILVLVVLAAFFSGAIGGGQQGLSLESAFNQACTNLRAAYNCRADGLTSLTAPNYGRTANDPKFGKYTLKELCDFKGLGSSDTTCLAACGCATTP